MNAFEDACRRFRSALGTLAEIPDSEWDFLRGHLKPMRYAPAADLIRAGAHARHIWFLDAGLLRFFYVSPGGREFNKAFSRAGEIVGPLVATITGEPCAFTIQALEPTETVAMPLEIRGRLHERHRCWERLSRLLAEQAAVRKEIREREFLLDDPMERYRHFRERYPWTEGRITQRQIAAYIGISEVQLSRLLNRTA